MRIGELAARSGVSPRSLRYYEAQRLLRAQRTPSGHRAYADDAVDRVVLIQWAFAAGLCSSVLRRMLAALDHGCDHDASTILAAEHGRLIDAVANARRQLATFDQLLDNIRSRAVVGADETTVDNHAASHC